MRIAAPLLLCFALGPAVANATCVIESGPHPEANAFLATVVSEEIVGGQTALHPGEYYRVQYHYAVRAQLRGKARTDLVLYSMVMYNDPASSVYVDVAEAFAYAPGETLLVAYDDQAEVPVSLCGPSTGFKGSISQAQKEWAK